MCLLTKGQASLCLFLWLLLGTKGDCIRLCFNTINIRTGIYFPDSVSFGNIKSISYSVTLKLYLSFRVNFKVCDLHFKLMTQLLVKSRMNDFPVSRQWSRVPRSQESSGSTPFPNLEQIFSNHPYKVKSLLFSHISLHTYVIKQNHLRFDFLIFTLKAKDKQHLFSTKWFVIFLKRGSRSLYCYNHFDF